MTAPTPLRIVIVGGVAGGMSAAARARRVDEHARITVIERGGFISFANCGLPYHIAGRIPHDEQLLITNPVKVKDRFNIDVRLHTEAIGIDRARKVLRLRAVESGAGSEIPYDKLILTPGASPIVPAIEGLRGHVATRILKQSGFADVRNVKGGWELARRQGVPGRPIT